MTFCFYPFAAALQVNRADKPPTTARNIIKDPMVLEFLGLKLEAVYYEKDLKKIH